MMKRKLTVFLLSLCAYFVLWSCRQEFNIINDENIKEQRFLVERKKSSEFHNNKKLTDKLGGIKNKIANKNQSLLGKYENTVFNVNLNDALYIEDTSNGNHSYIFRIDNNDSSSFDLENLVLKPNSSNDYDAYLVTYNLTEAEREAISNGHNVDVSNKTTIQSLDSNNISISAKSGSTCYELVIYGETDCTCCTVHAATGCTHPDTLYEWVQVPCGTGGSTGGDNGGTGDTGAPPGSGGTGSGSGTGGSNGSGGILITPDGDPVDVSCDKLQAQKINTDFSERIQKLKDSLNLKREIGYTEDTNGFHFKGNSSASEDANTLTLGTPTVGMIGFMHIHPNDYVDSNGDTRKGFKIFSPADVIYFCQMVAIAKQNGKPLDNIYAVVVTSKGNYQLRFTGNINQVKTTYNNTKQQYNEMYKKYFERNAKKSDELNFLKFMDEYMYVKGVTLVKMNDDGTFTKKTLNDDKSDVKDTPCS